MTRPQEKNPEHQAIETVSVLAFFCLIFDQVFNFSALRYAALGLLFIGLFIKRPARIIAESWMRFAAALSALNTRIILSVIFSIVLTPIALLYRLTHGDIMNIKRDDPSKKSFWKERNHLYKPEDLDKQW